MKSTMGSGTAAAKSESELVVPHRTLASASSEVVTSVQEPPAKCMRRPSGSLTSPSAYVKQSVTAPVKVAVVETSHASVPSANPKPDGGGASSSTAEIVVTPEAVTFSKVTLT